MDLNYARTLTDGGTGFRYETKITALFALRLNNYFLDFYLACNFENAGKFDDVVFTIKHDGEWRTWFIQLKHRLASTVDKKKITVSALRSKGDLVLKQYFDSYKETAKKFSEGSDHPIFGKSFSQARFGIFTNAILHQEISSRNHSVVECEFLSTNPGIERNIMFDLQKDDDIFYKMKRDWYIADFVDRLFLFTQQASENELDALIQKEIRSAVPGLKMAQLKLIAHEWFGFVQRWAASARYLTKSDVQQTLLRLSKEAQYGKRNEVSIKFTDSFLKFEKDQLDKDRLLHVVCDVDSTIMVMTGLIQMGLMNEPHISVNLRSLEHDDETQLIMINWLRNTNIKLVIDCEGDNLGVNKDKIIVFIRNLIGVTKANKVLLVSTKNNVTAADIALELKAKRHRFNCSLKNLSDESKAMIREKDVEFQGYKTILSTLMPSRGKHSKLDDVFDMTAITQLLQGRLVKVGLKPVEEIPYYVTRVLTRLATVTQGLFTSPDITASYALSGITLNDALELFINAVEVFVTTSTQILSHYGNRIQPKVVVILEGDPESEFTELSQRSSVPLHWFERNKKDGKLWHWKESTSNVLDVTKRLHTTRDFVPTDNIMVINDKCVVITAEPGMGKSTLLEHLAAETKRLCPHVWVICLALNDYTEHFERKDFISNIAASTKTLIAAAAGVDKETSKFDARLFNQCYDVTGNMIVLLDGFDEITPYYMEQGLAMIRALVDSSIDKVWVTARPVLRETLESVTSTIAYTIKPFVLKDQRMFMRKYWKHELPDMEDALLNEFVEKVLDLVNSTFDKKLAQFTGIPLQTRMVAEVFTDDIKRYHESGNLLLDRNVNGVKLFDDFVRIKRGVQMEKAKIPVNAGARWEVEQLNEQREQELMKLALLTLLPAPVCATLTPPLTPQGIAQLRALVNEGKEKSGIVLSFKGESPQFIHRTFAEYFAALFFAKNFESNRRFMSGDTFFSLPFEFVKYFFDNMLAAGLKLHDAVLRRDIAAVQHALNEGADVNEIDAGGRTALHLSAALPDALPIITLLLQANAKVDIYDTVLYGSPVDYAIKLKMMENVAPLLEHSTRFMNGGEIPVTWSHLKLAVQGDYLNLFKQLVENGIMEIEPMGQLTPQKWLDDSVSHGLTLLHIIAQYNAMKILRYLLSDEDTKSILVMLINIKNGKRVPPVLQAARAGHLEMARLLVELGGDPLVAAPDGKSLAAYAVEAHDLDFVLEILSAGTVRGLHPAEYLSPALTALVADKSEWAFTALELLVTTFPELMFVQTVKKTSLLVAASIKGNEKIVRKLWELGANVNEVTTLGSPLHYAVVGGHEETVRQLLACPQIAVDVVDREGCTPLHKAALKGYPTIFQMLLGAQANLKIATANGDDLTHAVAQSGDECIFYYLLDENLNFLQKNNAGKTAFDILKENEAYMLLQALDPCFEIPAEIEAAVKGKDGSVKAKKGKGSKGGNPLPIVAKCDGQESCPLEKALNDVHIGKANPIHTYTPVTNAGVKPKPLMNFNVNPYLPPADTSKRHSLSPQPLMGDENFARPALGKSSTFMKITQNNNFNRSPVKNMNRSPSPTITEASTSSLENDRRQYQRNNTNRGRGNPRWQGSPQQAQNSMDSDQVNRRQQQGRGRGRGGNRGNRSNSQGRLNFNNEELFRQNNQQNFNPWQNNGHNQPQRQNQPGQFQNQQPRNQQFRQQQPQNREFSDQRNFQQHAQQPQRQNREFSDQRNFQQHAQQPQRQNRRQQNNNNNGGNRSRSEHRNRRQPQEEESSCGLM